MSKKKSKSRVLLATPPSLSRKKREKLEAREAELAAELAKRRKKADKKADKVDLKSAKKSAKKSEASNAKAAKKKAKGKSTVPAPVEPEKLIDTNVDIPGLDTHGGMTTETFDETVIPIIDHTPDEIRAAAEKVLADPDSSPSARDKATKALETASIKERVQKKRAEREAAGNVRLSVHPDAAEGETEADFQGRKLKEKRDKDREEKTASDFPGEGSLDRVPAIEKHVAEVVETELGRIFETGAPAAEKPASKFAKPSEAGPELEEGRNGYKIIQLGADGKPDPRKIRQMTRVTTFVSNIDDETTLKAWDKRKLAEGLAMDAMRDERGTIGDPMFARINDIVHRRDVKIAKATKADRKGKLGIGEVGRIIAAAEKEAKDALDAIVEEAGELAGRFEKANAGTHLHTLAEISDEKGIDEVRRMHEAGETVEHAQTGEQWPITATDLASIEAYAARMARLGAKVIHSESVIVNDELGFAGRLDRVVMAKLPELTLSDGTKRPADQRARRYIADIKSGRIDYGAGKIGRQLAAYASGDLYDLETGERTRHSAAKDVALVFHLPQGEGVCTVHAVDIKAGLALLKLSAEVRRARNTGRKLIDTKVDIADPAPETD